MPPRVPAPEPPPPVHVEEVAPAPADVETASSSVQEFSFDVPDHLVIEPGAAPAAATAAFMQPEHSTAAPEVQRFAAAAEPVAEADGSGEWESMLSVEEDGVHSAPVEEMPVINNMPANGASPPARTHNDRVAILPFRDKTGSPDLAWIALGLMSIEIPEQYGGAAGTFSRWPGSVSINTGVVAGMMLAI